MKNRTLNCPARFLLASLFAILPLTLASAQSDAPPKQASAPKPRAASTPSATMSIPDIPYTKFVLANGLTVLVHEDHKAPIVAVNTWYHVGSKNEKPGKTGFAHLFEHLMFSGSENFNYTYINAMERIGATNLNGTTNGDRTNYFENVPTSMLDYVLFAESDRMGHLLAVLDQKKLDLQRGVVQNEKRQGENQPYGVTRQLLAENTYPVGHPYSWTTIGSMTDLDAASMNDVQEWFKTYYGPNNVTLVIAGDITPEVARQKVEKYYGGIPPGPPVVKRETWIAKRTGTHRDSVQDRVPQARLYRVWNVPQADSPGEAMLDMIAQILGQGKTSRLYKRLVYKDQIATSATADDGNAEIAGQFTITLTAKPGGDLKTVEAAADQELQAFLKNGPTEAELQLAKTQIFGQYARIMERIGGFGGKSDILAKCQTFTGNPDCYKDYLKWVQAATPASIKKAADDWLSDGDYVLEVQPYPTTLKAAAPIDRSKEPAAGSAMSLNLPADAEGYALQRPENCSCRTPHCSGRQFLFAGWQRLFRGLSSCSRHLQFLSAHARRGNSDSRFSEDWRRTGISQRRIFCRRQSRFCHRQSQRSQSQSGQVPRHLRRPHPPSRFSRKRNSLVLQKDRLAAIQREKVTPISMGTRVMPPLLYGKTHPYAGAFLTTGTESSVSKMTREDLVKFHDTWFKPNNATLLIVGDTSLADITPKLEKLFASWKSGDVPKLTIPSVSQPQSDVVYLLDRPGSGQSIILAAQLAPPYNDPDQVSLDLVNDIFGGNFSSRINMNLREDKHWSYGVRSRVVPARSDRSLLQHLAGANR